MVYHSTNNFTGNMPSGYSSDPATQTEWREGLIASGTDPHLLSNFTPTQYIGMTKFDVPTNIKLSFADFNLYDPITGSNASFLGNTSIQNIQTGVQLLKIKANCFSTILTDPEEIEANGGSNIKYNFGSYFLTVRPKYIQTTVTQIQPRRHYEFSKLSDNQTTSNGFQVPAYKRRTVIVGSNNDFRNSPWSFESQPNQAGRLLGSVVEVWNSAGTELKQIKVIAENALGFNFGSLYSFVLSPDNVGYDPTSQEVAVGDILRVYPRESYFNQIVVAINFEDSSANIKAALQYMMNDVARDMKTGVYEVYDQNGLSIDSAGNFNGTVVQKYQVEQFGQYEIRKKIRS